MKTSGFDLYRIDEISMLGGTCKKLWCIETFVVRSQEAVEEKVESCPILANKLCKYSIYSKT